MRRFVLYRAMGRTSFLSKHIVASRYEVVAASGSWWVSITVASIADEEFFVTSPPLGRDKAVNLAMTVRCHYVESRRSDT